VKTAIVTGSYGYIGSVLTKILKENDYYVVGIDNHEDHGLDWVNGGPRTKYCDDTLAEDFVSSNALHLYKEYPNATIFHLAANSLLGPSAYDPLSYYENNTIKTLKLIQSIKPSNKLIFASTAAVYAETDKCVSEGSKICPPNNYGRSKLWCEQMLDASYEIINLRAASFRFFNVIGAYGDVGQLPETPHIVNQLCDRSMKKEVFTINGTGFDTRDGTCVRDYLHVVDVSKALIHADNYIGDEPCHHKFNLGTKHGYSVKEIVDIFKHECHNVDVKIGSPRIGDPPYLVANPNKFIKQTGFKYKMSDDLVAMIKSAWEYRNAFRGK